MKRDKIENLVGIFLIFMVAATVVLVLAGCAGMAPSEKEAAVTKLNSVMEEVFRRVPGGGVVNDITSIAGILWAALFTKKKVGKKLQEIKDSKPGEYTAKTKKAA
jgi:uncharacterized protein YjeT (DUF2065 family)